MERAYLSFFAKFARIAATVTGFIIAVSIIIAWAISGPLFGSSDTCKHDYNDFPNGFLIQNTQNRDAEARQKKLYEHIRATKGARNEVSISMNWRSAN